MWHLLKTEWSNKILAYFLAVAVPHFLIKDKYFTENTEKAKVALVGFILAVIIAGLVIMTIVEAARNGSDKHTDIRFRALLPLSLNKQYFVRLLTGPLFVILFLTIEAALYLFFIHSRIDNYDSYWIMLTSGMIVIICQLVTGILSDLSTRGSPTSWLANQTVQILVFLALSVSLTFASIFFQIRREQFFGPTDTIVCAIFTLCIMWISQKTFIHRKSFLR